MGFSKFWRRFRQTNGNHNVQGTLGTSTQNNAKISSAPIVAFSYTPLSSPTAIRLLDILPGQGHDDVRFVLVEVDLDNGIHDWSALSYTWGPAHFPHTISSATGSLKITENLFGALKQLRNPTQKVRLWADAVCINQNDLKERAQQILLMRRIYAQCHRVLVWLGPGKAIDTWALSFIRTFVDRYAIRIFGSMNNPEQRRELLDEISDTEPFSPGNCNALTKFFEWGWFSRAWTFQEIASGTNAGVFCGSRYIHYDYLSTFATAWHVIGGKIHLLSPEAQKNLGSIIGVCAIKNHVNVKDHPQTSLLELLRSAQSRQATDPRDRIYSLVSLASNTRPLPYPPSYEVSTATLYLDIAEHMISQQNGLDILGFCVFQSGVRDNPSWVPDWSKDVASVDLRANKVPYCATGSHTCNAVLAENRQHLLVRGKPYDRINDLSECHMKLSGNFTGGGDWDEYKPILRKQSVVLHDVLRMIASSPRYLFESGRRETFSRALVGDRMAEDGARVSDQFLKLVWQFRENVGNFLDGDPDIDGLKFIEHEQVESRLVYIASGRRFCLTRSGHVGWVPLETQKGDIVGLVCGSKVPLILRPAGDTYLVVGQSYIHGIMDGEATPTSTEDFQTMKLA